MARSRRWTISIVVWFLIPAFLVTALSGQTIEIREHLGKEIACVLGGLRGFGRLCGTGGGYTYVFIGSVLSTVDISDTEKRLQITPEEVFLGNSVSELTVLTNQGACLPDIQPGDEWLFYLQRDAKTRSLLLAYGSPSKPVSDAQDSIAMRRLEQMTDSGIVTGEVTRQVWNENKWETSVPVPNHKIVAKRVSDGTEYVTFTDSNGRYEFEPLPSGTYELAANTAQGLWAEGGRTEVHSRSCSEVGFGLQPDGRISGRVWTADGKPARYTQVAIVPESAGNLVFTSALADEDGYFEVTGLHPGRYLVGVGIQAQPGSPERKSSIYYPGVRTRDQAVIIDLGQAEKRTNMDFQLRNSVAP